MRIAITVTIVLGASAAAAGDAAAQWGPETPITATGGDVWGEGLAATGTTVHMIYGTGEVRYQRSTDEGATWSASRRLDGGTLHLTDPLVADGDDVWAVYQKDLRNVSDWCCSRDLGNLYLLRSSDAGVTWKPPVQLSTRQGAFRVSIAAAAGRVHVVWMDYRDGVWDTYYRRSIDRGATWEPERVIARSAGPFGAERPQIAVAGDHVHVTIWDDRGDNPPCVGGTYTFPHCPDVFYVGSADGGVTWGEERRIADAGAAFAGRNDIAAAGAADVVINYNRDVAGTTGQKMFVRHSGDHGATWDPPVQLTLTPGESDHGSIIGAGRGVFLAWHDARVSGNLEIWMRASQDGGATWLPEEPVSTGAPQDSSTPLVAVSEGWLHVMWLDHRSGSFQIYYRRRALPAPPVPDAPPDAGPDAAVPLTDGGDVVSEPGGCGCRTSAAPSWPALLAPLALLARRRRR